MSTAIQIDSHQHFWALERGDYGWLTPALAPIYRDFAPHDLEPILRRHGIARTILVQAAPTLEETLYLMKLAAVSHAPAASTFVAGVVGWVDLEAAEAPALIARIATDPVQRTQSPIENAPLPGGERFDRLLVGLRPMVHDIADPEWLLRASIAPAIEAMIAHDLVFDALVKPPHLRALRGFLDRHPGLRVVVDHGAKPEIAKAIEQPWLDDLKAIAAYPDVTCKLSGLVTEAAPDWRPDDILPYVARLLELFGPGRLLWGSDWPVVNLAGGYDVWRALTAQALQELTPDQRAAILGGNAARVYLSRGRGVV
jgi:L-fuconolactonase